MRYVFLMCAAWVGLAGQSAATAAVRVWTDKSGHYTVEAELLASSDAVVVLQKPNKDLISIGLDQLSTDDHQYLESKAAQDATQAGGLQTWTTRSGLKVQGRVVSYVRKEVTIQRRRGKIYVNDRQYDNLPGVYKEMIPRIVGFFEQKDIQDKAGFESWVLTLRGAPKVYTCEGVMLELENHDLYGVPFFLFSEKDQQALKPGWERWAAAQEDSSARERHAVELEAKARAYQQEQSQAREAMQLQLFLQGYDAGLFDLWEVALFPPNPSYPPLLIVVPGRNSQQAAAAALQRYPNYRVGAVGKARRRT